MFISLHNLQNNEMPRPNTLVLNMKTDEIAVVLDTYPDVLYYDMLELQRHPAIEVKYLDTTEMESDTFVFKSQEASMLCLEDISILRKGRVMDTPRLLQAYAFGLYNNRKKLKYKEEKTVRYFGNCFFFELFLVICNLLFSILFARSSFVRLLCFRA